MSLFKKNYTSEDCKIIIDKKDIKPKQILLLGVLIKGHLKGVEKIVRELDTIHDGVYFTDRTWMNLDKLIQERPTYVGEVKTFLKYFTYHSYF